MSKSTKHQTAGTAEPGLIGGSYNYEAARAEARRRVEAFLRQSLYLYGSDAWVDYSSIVVDVAWRY